MQSADDMKLGDRFAISLARAMPDFLQRHGVRVRVLGALSEGAEAATGHANVGGIDVPVDVEVSLVAVQSLPDYIREIAEPQKIGRAVQCDAVVEGQPLSG